MGQTSKISWTDGTQNFWYGCRKKSPGCAYCYMFRWANRSGRDPEKVTRTKDSTFYAPLKWKEPLILFTCSLSDFFIEEADAWRADAHKVMEETPQHTYLILTKEIERAVELGYVPPKNALLGVSTENQHWLDVRVPLMFKIPASGYFISAEPLLGPLDILRWVVKWPWWCERCGVVPEMNAETHLHCHDDGQVVRRSIDWVIAGGESGGPDHRRLVRPHDCGAGHADDCLFKGREWEPKSEALKWVRDIRDRCVEAGMKFHLKQWGGPRPDSAGALLDGREWREIPK